MPRHLVASTLMACVLALGGVDAASAQPAPAASIGVASDAAASPRSGVWYEIFVRSWYDTDDDGIGDLDGVTAKLDYLDALGVSGIWLMPIQPSPSYHGYDVTDYKAVNPHYGTLADFRELVAAAHARGIDVIIDMVVNHSSNEHPWFQAALDPDSPYRDWYTWPGPYTDVATPNAFGGPAWHENADGQYYLSIFAPTMPDLNLDNPAVRAKMIDIGRFWLKQGADGFRLDAARHIDVDLISDVGAPAVIAKNIDWWQQYRDGLEAVDPDVYLVGEVTREEAADLAPYLTAMDAVFNFPLAARLIAAAQSERNLGIADTLEHTYATYRRASGSHAIKDAPFLSNHDQQRVMTQLKGNMAHMRMAAAMLLTLPGHPYIYYGEELGMRGSKPDPDLRTPMRWQRALDASGATTWHATSPNNGAAISVAAEQAKPQSLLHHYRRLIDWRTEIPALRDGGFRAYPEASDHLLVWQRTAGADTVLVVHNLSGTPQSMALDVPDEPRFTRVLKATHPGVTIDGHTLHVPAYTTAVLQ